MRFIAFGCSNTWGDGITPADSWNTPPSKYSWVQWLSDTFGIPVLNLAVSGGSNSLILHKIKQHEWQPGDIALILWTFLERDTIFGEDNAIKHVSAYHIDNSDRPYTKQYYTLFPEYHITYTNLRHIEHAYFYLDKNKIPAISRFNDKDITFSLDKFDKKIAEDYQKITLLETYNSLTNELNKEQVGADGMHCNSLVHRLFAQSIEPELSEIIHKLS